MLEENSQKEIIVLVILKVIMAILISAVAVVVTRPVIATVIAIEIASGLVGILDLHTKHLERDFHKIIKGRVTPSTIKATPTS